MCLKRVLIVELMISKKMLLVALVSLHHPYSWCSQRNWIKVRVHSCSSTMRSKIHLHPVSNAEIATQVQLSRSQPLISCLPTMSSMLRRTKVRSWCTQAPSLPLESRAALLTTIGLMRLIKKSCHSSDIILKSRRSWLRQMSFKASDIHIS